LADTVIQYFVCPVSLIRHRGRDVEFPLGSKGSGYHTGMVKSWMKGIMYGNEQHHWGVVVDEKHDVFAANGS
jgi:branched-chain amino acid aminotransferase